MEEFLDFHIWIILAALLSAASCALLGTFLVLRKMSLLGDAISHSILPGLAIAFLISGSRAAIPMFVGAAFFGLLAAFLSHFLARHCNVDRGASLGVVFTSFFALGVILIRKSADKVDLDPGCVLYGLLEFTPLDQLSLFGYDIPRSVVILGVVFAINASFVWLFYKELTITSFDAALACTLGINATLVHYMLMAAVAITCIAAFESVGSIIVVAMFIVPGASARLFTDRLTLTIFLSLLFACISAVLGYLFAYYWNTTAAGMMSVVAGVIFGLSVLFAPRYGLLSKAFHLMAVRLRVYAEDILGLVYRLQHEPDLRQNFSLSARNIAAAMGGGIISHLALHQLCLSKELLRLEDDTFALSALGETRARTLVRKHRLWETYLSRYLHLAPDHVHQTATKLEHFTDRTLEVALATKVKNIQYDPHGKPIPEAED